MNSIGIDTGASFTRIWDGERDVLKLQTPNEYAHYLQLLNRTLKRYDPIQTLVIALPGVIEKQQIVKAPNLGSSWRGKNIEADLCKLLGVRDKILILQDTEAAGYAIQGQELNSQEPTMLITLSTGVGGALVTRDFILPLEVGHIALNLSGGNMKCSCGDYGCVEADISGTAITKRTGMRAESLKDQSFWTNYGNELGRFLLLLSKLFKLKQIILMGGVSQRHSLFLEITQLYLSSTLFPTPKLRISPLGDNAGVYGAYRLATQS
jgi:glucokinase